MHNLEHGYTILWYDETVADDDDMLNAVEGIAEKFRSDDDNFRFKFIAAPWTSEDGERVPRGPARRAHPLVRGGDGETDTPSRSASRSTAPSPAARPSRSSCSTTPTPTRPSRTPGRSSYVRSARPVSLERRDDRLTSCARLRVVTSSASGVSTTTTSSMPIDRDRPARAGHDQAGAVHHPHQRLVTEHHGERAVGGGAEQLGQRVEVADVLPAERRGHGRHPAGVGRGLGDGVVDRDLRQRLPTAPRRRPGSAAISRSVAAKAGSVSASRSSSTVGRTTNMPAFQRYSPLARYSRATCADGFSTNARTRNAPG